MHQFIKLLCVITIVSPLYVIGSEQECVDIRNRLVNLYNAPSERAIDDARKELKSKLQHARGATSAGLPAKCLQTLRELSSLAERCVKTLASSKVNQSVPLPCPTDFDDQPMLQYAVRGTVNDNQTFSNTLANTERFLDPDRRCHIYDALSRETLKGDLKSVQNLHRSILAHMVNPYITEEQNKSLKRAIKNMALKAMMNKIEGEYQPGFMVQLTSVCNFTAANAVRDAIVDIANKEGQIGRGNKLDDIVQPVLELHKYLSPQDITYPFGMLIGYTTSLLKKSPHYDRLQTKDKDQVDKIIQDTPKFYNKLFADGEFCHNTLPSSTESSPNWKSSLYIRNKGTFRNPLYSWYNWTETSRGRLLMVGGDDFRMVVPDEVYNFKRTLYQNSEKKVGLFKEVTPDVCSKEFKNAGKMMSLPLDNMMSVHKNQEETGKSYFETLGLQVDGDCPR